MEPKVLDNRNNDDNGSSNNNSKKNIDNFGIQWTNEKHSNFLRVMEARFVRNMLEKSIINNNVAHLTNSRLDRFVPDMSESTLDLCKLGKFLS